MYRGHSTAADRVRSCPDNPLARRSAPREPPITVASPATPRPGRRPPRRVRGEATVANVAPCRPAPRGNPVALGPRRRRCEAPRPSRRRRMRSDAEPPIPLCTQSPGRASGRGRWRNIRSFVGRQVCCHILDQIIRAGGARESAGAGPCCCNGKRLGLAELGERQERVGAAVVRETADIEERAVLGWSEVDPFACRSQV